MSIRALAILVLALSAGCKGGDSPVSPTAPTTPTLPPVSIVSVGSMKQGGCIGNMCSYSNFRIQNNGPGCARAVDLRGTITLYDSAGKNMGTATWELKRMREAERVDGVVANRRKG